MHCPVVRYGIVRGNLICPPLFQPLFSAPSAVGDCLRLGEVYVIKDTAKHRNKQISSPLA